MLLSETMHSSSGGEIRLSAKDDDALRATIRVRLERMSKFNPSDRNPGLLNNLPPRDILLALSLSSDHTSDDLGAVVSVLRIRRLAETDE